MPRKDQGWVTFRLPETERQLLERYCQQTERSKTDVLRQLVRTLAAEGFDPTVSAVTREGSSCHRDWETQALRVSARNVFPAVISQVRLGSVNAQILLAVAPDIEFVSIITRASAELLQLHEGKTAHVMIKSSDVMVVVYD